MGKFESFIEKQDRIISNYKRMTLIALGLYEKEYSPDGKQSREYSSCEPDENGKRRYYRKVPIEITDEQWKELTEKLDEVKQIGERDIHPHKKKTKSLLPVSSSKSTSGVATALRIAALLLAVAYVICGIVLVSTFGGYAVIASIVFAAITVLLFFALAGILDYLAVISTVAQSGFKYVQSDK